MLTRAPPNPFILQIVFENVAYKENCPVPIIENSQKLEVAKMVAQCGKKVVIRDRPAIVDEVRKLYGSLFAYERTTS